MKTLDLKNIFKISLAGQYKAFWPGCHHRSMSQTSCRSSARQRGTTPRLSEGKKYNFLFFSDFQLNETPTEHMVGTYGQRTFNWNVLVKNYWITDTAGYQREGLVGGVLTYRYRGLYILPPPFWIKSQVGRKQGKPREENRWRREKAKEKCG